MLKRKERIVMRNGQYVAKGMNVSCRTIGGSAFILREDTRDLLQLDEVGSFIWDLINGRKTIDEIIEICCRHFIGEQEEIRQAVREFLSSISENGIVDFSDKPFKGVMANARH